MIHVYECNDGATTYYEVYDHQKGAPYRYLRTFDDMLGTREYLNNIGMYGARHTLHRLGDGSVV